MNKWEPSYQINDWLGDILGYDNANVVAVGVITRDYDGYITNDNLELYLEAGNTILAVSTGLRMYHERVYALYYEDNEGDLIWLHNIDKSLADNGNYYEWYEVSDWL